MTRSTSSLLGDHVEALGLLQLQALLDQLVERLLARDRAELALDLLA